MLKSCCRQCRASIATKAERCPLCGLSKPNVNELSFIEKEFLQNNPMIPPQHQDMIQTVDPGKLLMANIISEFSRYAGSVSQNLYLWTSFILIAMGGFFSLISFAFPLSFMMFWAGLVYAAYEGVVLVNAVSNTYILKRLQNKKGLSPYSVHFKLELQLEAHLNSLRSVTCSIIERDWSKTSPELRKASESFCVAIKVLTERIQKNAVVSLETASIIWRNNVYAILASNQASQEKAMAIGAKCREAEAMLMRFLWLNKLPEIEEVLKDYIANPKIKDPKGTTTFASKVLEQFNLTMFGPLEEPFVGNFEHTPHDLPFKGRNFWLKRLPPFPFEDDGSLANCPQAQDLIESLRQVRQLKSHLEDQMVIDCVAKSVSDVSPLEEGYTTAMEAQEIARDSLYSNYLDVPKFRPDSREVQEEVDRIAAEARVALGAEKVPE